MGKFFSFEFLIQFLYFIIYSSFSKIRANINLKKYLFMSLNIKINEKLNY